MKNFLLAAGLFLAAPAQQPSPVPHQVNVRSFRHFLQTYATAANVQWDVLKDGSTLCRFQLGGVKCKAYYTRAGVWTCTVSSYDESHLAREIRAQVKRVYYDHAITWIDEVDRPWEGTLYRIQIEDKKELRIIQITDDGMETLEVLNR